VTGAVDLAALERMLAGARPAFVHLTQFTSHRGLVQPVAEAAALCRAAGVPLWVDAAQALGHVDTACGALGAGWALPGVSRAPVKSSLPISGRTRDTTLLSR